ncbi:MAG: aromatic amino acid lyase [Anaerolineae bacterium]|nr:aromatic amino acid lyase [Anaerolineae bacterium]
MTGANAMAAAGIPRLRLLAKEGLALNNGATVSAAMAALIVHDAVELVKHAEIALAMSLEAIRGTADAFHVLPHRARNHRGQQVSAANVRRLIKGSVLVAQGPQEETIHDAYSLRCGPQVLGAVRDVLAFVWDRVTDEINAATDNPLLFVDDPELDPSRVIRAISCGNFHGEPVAFALDFLAIVLTELASIAERRLFRLTDNLLSRGLPLMLLEVDKTGLNSGMMIAQYTAAALVSECKTLAHPDSVDSIPSSADWEDHVSMSMNAGLHALKVLENARYVVAIEMLCAAQALDFRLAGLHFWREEPWRKEGGAWRKDVHMHRWETEPLSPGAGVRAAYDTIREAVPKVEQDRPLHPDIERLAAMIAEGMILRAVADAGAPLFGLEAVDVAEIEQAGR